MPSRPRTKRPGPRRKIIPIKEQIHRRAASLEPFYPAKLILERNGFLTGQQLAHMVEKSEGKILPPWLNRYLVDFLRGKTKRPKGRPRQSDPEIDFLLADLIELFELKRAEFAKIPKAERNVDPRIPAANYLVMHSSALRSKGWSAIYLLNLFSEFGYLKRRPRLTRPKQLR